MSRAVQLAELYRCAALAGLTETQRRFRVQQYLNARARASFWTKVGATFMTWDLDKTDRARVLRELDRLTTEGRSW